MLLFYTYAFTFTRALSAFYNTKEKHYYKRMSFQSVWCFWGCSLIFPHFSPQSSHLPISSHQPALNYMSATNQEGWKLTRASLFPFFKSIAHTKSQGSVTHCGKYYLSSSVYMSSQIPMISCCCDWQAPSHRWLWYCWDWNSKSLEDRAKALPFCHSEAYPHFFFALFTS